MQPRKPSQAAACGAGVSMLPHLQRCDLHADAGHSRVQRRLAQRAADLRQAGAAGEAALQLVGDLRGGDDGSRRNES